MNFRRILSKSSVKSSSSASGNQTNPAEEIAQLQGEVELLKQTIESMKISVESRDAAIGTLAREKEKLYVELKSVQRTNRNLHQQLVDERDMHSKEKDYLIAEIERLKKDNDNEYSQKQDSFGDVASNLSFRERMKAKDEVIYNICVKYFKIKTSKLKLQRKCQKLEKKSLKVCENVILLLRQNKLSLDSLLHQVVRASTTAPSCEHYLKLLKLNSDLHFENTELKVCLSLKDFTKVMDDETVHTEQLVRPTKVSKSEGKIEHAKSRSKNQPLRPRPCNAKFYKIPERESLSKFNSIHGTFSPYFRRKKYCYSDPCLVGNT